MSEYVLEMKDVYKAFPGVVALNHVKLQLKPGTVHALMGENGAGKSTLMKCMFGIYSMDEGEIYIDGNKTEIHNPMDALNKGIAMVHQELQPIPARTIGENIYLGRYPMKKALGFIPMVDHKKMYEDAERVLKEVRMTFDPHTKVGDLSVSQMQSVEIAKAVSANCRVLILDEPTSSLTQNEVEALFRIVEDLKAKGVAIVYISHKMDEILRISDDITIMRDGKWVSTTPAKDLTMDLIIKQMVGRELTNRFPPKTNKPGEVMLKVENLTGFYNQLKDVSFEVRKGEILGVAGLDGAGRTEILECLFGYATKLTGDITLNGKKIANKNPKEAKKNGFALLTEERRATGIFGILDIRKNATICNLKSYKKGFWLSDKKMKTDTDWVINSMRVKTPSQETKIRALSGGNQQKVIIGRWLLTNPDVLLLDEPTRGIDVGAKYEIYQLIINLANDNKAVIMVSSEMPELLGVCDRIMVMSGGRVAGTVDAKTATQEEILTLAAKYV